MITDEGKLPSQIECLECKRIFQRDIFLWHDCDNPSLDQKSPFSDDNEEEETEQPLNAALVTPLERLPFKFLPPEKRDVVEELRSHLRRTSASYPREVDWSRLYQIQRRFDAVVIALGEDGWSGYAVFKIAGRERFLLDSVVSGNAAYVVEGDWRRAIHYSKAEIREEYRNAHKRVIHTGDWLNRIAKTLLSQNLSSVR